MNFIKEKMQMSKKYMKRCSTSSFIREIYVKTTIDITTYQNDSNLKTASAKC